MDPAATVTDEIALRQVESEKKPPPVEVVVRATVVGAVTFEGFP